MKRLSKFVPLAVNIVLPLLIYHYAAPHFGERNALILYKPFFRAALIRPPSCCIANVTYR